MFGKQIILKDDSFKVGGKKVLWSDITGIREFDSNILRQFSYRKAFPRMELFLKNGKVISVNQLDQFQNRSMVEGQNGFETFKKLLNKNLNGKDRVLDNWLEWRLLLPVAVCEILVGIYAIVERIDFSKIPSYMISGIVAGGIIGFMWERKARKKARCQIGS
jgi:hypothetical protein